MKLKPLLFCLCNVIFLAACSDSSPGTGATKVASKPALTVTTVAPQQLDWLQTLTAGGNIAPWQEAVIGPEISNYRITEVSVNVGDRVARGQTLASISAEVLESEHAEFRASVAEAQASAAEARANHERARQLREKGFFSPQQVAQTQAAAETAQARLEGATARLNSASLRKSKTAILAPDSGIISVRNATVGSIVQPGQELFRLIRGARLEWRAEVSAADLGRIRPGQTVIVTAPDGAQLEGKVRAVAPTVDPRTHTALIYVDLPANAASLISAGMFARGEFRIGSKPALTVPQSALLQRDGFAYVFRVEDSKVTQVKVVPGRRNSDRIEVAGLAADIRVVASGVGFLADGDSVHIVDDATGKSPQ